MADVTLHGATQASAHAPSLFTRIWVRLAERAEYRRTINELRNLDQRTLDDLGLSAADLEAVARGRIVRN